MILSRKTGLNVREKPETDTVFAKGCKCVRKTWACPIRDESDLRMGRSYMPRSIRL